MLPMGRGFKNLTSDVSSEFPVGIGVSSCTCCGFFLGILGDDADNLRAICLGTDFPDKLMDSNLVTI